MPTSIHQGLIDFDKSLYGTAGTPMDATTMRDGIANGLLHIADSSGQVRVNYLARPEEYLQPLKNAEGVYPWDTWMKFEGAPFGPWPLTLHQNASGYFLRIRVGVSSSATLDPFGQPVRLYLRIVIAPLGDYSGLEPSDLAVDWHASTDWASDALLLSPGWRTVQSQGALNLNHAAFIGKEQVSAWLRSVPVYNGLSHSDPLTVNQVLVAAHVYAKTTDGRNSVDSIVPRIHALHISEFVG